MAENAKVSDRTKHIDVAYHHVRELIELKELILEHVDGNENPAHFLASKAIKSKEEFLQTRSLLLSEPLL